MAKTKKSKRKLKVSKTTQKSKKVQLKPKPKLKVKPKLKSKVIEPKAIKTPKKLKVKTPKAPKLPKIKLPKEDLEVVQLIEDIEVEDSQPEYVFKQYFASETQLKDITYRSKPERILEAFSRLIWVYASNHVRESVAIEDLIAEGQKGVCEAIKDFNDTKKKRPNYNFYQACLYKIRSSIYQYCLRNANQIKTPYYIQRGCMHVAQIFKLMSNQSVAEAILGKPGSATEAEILVFIYNEDERLPLKPLAFIKKQIMKKATKEEFQQILRGILEHELGSRHSYVKNNLTDVGKILHIKEKLWYTAHSNNMNYTRVIDLILSARQSQVELDISNYSPQHNNVEADIGRKELIKKGIEICGEENFNILMENKYYDRTYEEIAKLRNLKKNDVILRIKDSILLLRKDEFFIDLFNAL